MGIIGVLVIVVGLLISVALHECGHMIPAKKFGVYVPEFAVGFGPQIFGVKKGETTYSLRAILLGGYVRLVGMFAPARDGVKTRNRRGKLTLAQEAREASMEEIPEGYGSRAFYLLHPAQKIIVMISGPLVNLFLSILFLSIALVGIGIPKASLTLSEVPQQLTTQGATVDAPAYAAGIRAGDTITGVNGSAVTSWEQMRQSIAGSQGVIDIDYLRNGQLFHVKVDPLRSGDSVSIGVIAGTEYQAASVGTVASTVGETFTGTVSVVARLPIALWDVGRSISRVHPVIRAVSCRLLVLAGLLQMRPRLMSRQAVVAGCDRRRYYCRSWLPSIWRSLCLIFFLSRRSMEDISFRQSMNGFGEALLGYVEEKCRHRSILRGLCH